MSGWRTRGRLNIGANYFDVAQAAFAIPEKHDQSNSEQENKTNNQEDHRQQLSRSYWVRHDVN